MVHSGRSSENQYGNRNVGTNIVTIGFQKRTAMLLETVIRVIHILAKIWLFYTIFESLSQSQLKSSVSQTELKIA